MLRDPWRPCTRHPGYDVSWDGRVRNRRTGRVLAQGGAKSGRYRKVNLGRSLQVQVHQLVAEAWIGPKPDDRPHVVDHVDNDSRRNNLQNLRWLTRSWNTRQWYAMNARLQAAGIAQGHDRDTPELTDAEWAQLRETLDRPGW